MPLKKLRRRLTLTDAAFFYLEAPKAQMNIGICHLYEGYISRGELIHSLAARMHLLPRYRTKAVFPPLRLGHPTWEDDPTFNLDNHVEERFLSPQADDRELARVCGELVQPWMDRNRPLWRLVLLQGRPDGNTAIFWEVHHAMIDGISAVELIQVMHDLAADAVPPAPPSTPWQPRPVPDKLALAQDAVRSRLPETLAWLIDQVFSLFRPAQKIRDVRLMLSSIVKGVRAVFSAVPSSPFTRVQTSGMRQGLWVEFPLSAVAAIRAAFGGSINDIAMATIAGGMGRYMRAHGYPTDGVVLRALCPVSLRQDDERGTLGNIISTVAPPLHVGIADPGERLAAGKAAMDHIKRERHAEIVNRVMLLADRLPPALQPFLLPLCINTIAPRIGSFSSNVPGPPIPLYLAGHKLLRMSGIAPLVLGTPLFNGIISYEKNLVITPTVDVQCIPDGWFYVDCLRESFAELLAAAAAATVEMPAQRVA